MGGTMDMIKGAYQMTKGAIKLASGSIIPAGVANTIRNMYFNKNNPKKEISKAVDLSLKDVGDVIKVMGLSEKPPEGFMKKNMGGMANARKKNMGLKMAEGGAVDSGLKPVPSGNKGLSKLPTPVRNKMGFMKKGGMVKKRAKSSSKKSRGTGAAIRGTKFKGVF